MINTLNIKQAQLKNGFFTTGSGPTVILIMGSCRVCPYINYFNDWNIANGNQFTIHSLDPFNFNWNEGDNRVDYEEALRKWEVDDRMLNMIASVDIFIHEYYQNAGMFNVSPANGPSIYDFGMKPKQIMFGSTKGTEAMIMDICLPNFNDLFILFQDIVNFDVPLRKMALQDYNVIGKLSGETIKAIQALADANIEKFYNVCRLSSLPEMENFFNTTYKYTRLFWTSNHVSKAFTLAVFKMINDKYFAGTLYANPNHEDMFANNYTMVTEYEYYFWGEIIYKLRL